MDIRVLNPKDVRVSHGTPRVACALPVTRTVSGWLSPMLVVTKLSPRMVTPW